MKTRTVVRQDRPEDTEMPGHAAGPRPGPRPSGQRRERGDEFTAWYTQSRMKWLKAVASCPSASGLAVRCAIIMAEGFVSGEHAMASRELMAWPSQERLAEATQSTRDGVKKALERLAAAGLLHTRPGRGRGRNTRYILTLPSDEKTKTAVGVMGAANADARQAFAVEKTQTPVAAKRRLPSEKTLTAVCKNPVKEPFELTPQAEVAIDRIWKALPIERREISNTAKIREAVCAVLAEGVNPNRLAIAVESYCATSSRAKGEGGRMMGAPHTWLVEMRGWEAHMPSEDQVFLDGVAEADRPWLYRVRSWEISGRWERYDNGPAPGEEGCRVPADVLSYCADNPRLNNETRPAVRRAVGCVY